MTVYNHYPYHYPGPDDEFALMQQAAEVTDLVAAEMAAKAVDEFEQRREVIYAAGTQLAKLTIEAIEDYMPDWSTLHKFGDEVEADLAASTVSNQAEDFLRRHQADNNAGVKLGKKPGVGISEPNWKARVAFDQSRGLLRGYKLDPNDPRND